MKSENIIPELLARFPDLETIYCDEGEYVADNAHLVFSIIFYPYAQRVFRSIDLNSIKQKIANLINEMIESKDESTVEVAVASFLSDFSLDGLSESIRPYLSFKAKKYLDAQLKP